MSLKYVDENMQMISLMRYIHIHSYLICFYFDSALQGGPKKTIPKLNKIDRDTNDIVRTNYTITMYGH